MTTNFQGRLAFPTGVRPFPFIDSRAPGGQNCFAPIPRTNTSILRRNKNQFNSVQWNDVAYSPELNRLVAGKVGGGTLGISRNGVVWDTTSVASLGAASTFITWSADDRSFLAVLQGSSSTFSSRDGLTWVSAGTTAARTWSKVIYVAELGLYLTIANGGAAAGQVYTRKSVYNNAAAGWTAQTTAEGLGWLGVCWSPKKRLFCAVTTTAGVGPACMTSPDGVTWTQQPGFTGKSATDICWAERLGMFIAPSTAGNVHSSRDGMTWTTQTVSANNWSKVYYCADRHAVVIASSNTGTDHAVTYDGMNYSLIKRPATGDLPIAVYHPGIDRLVCLSSIFNSNGYNELIGV